LSAGFLDLVRRPRVDAGHPDVIAKALILLFDVAESLRGSAASFVIRASMQAAGT
jgi:hypothetical protein